MTNTKTLVILLSFMVKNLYLAARLAESISATRSTAFLMVPARPVILLSAMEQIPRRTPSAKGTAKMRSSWSAWHSAVE